MRESIPTVAFSIATGFKKDDGSLGENHRTFQHCGADVMRIQYCSVRMSTHTGGRSRAGGSTLMGRTAAATGDTSSDAFIRSLGKSSRLIA